MALERVIIVGRIMNIIMHMMKINSVEMHLDLLLISKMLLWKS